MEREVWQRRHLAHCVPESCTLSLLAAHRRVLLLSSWPGENNFSSDCEHPISFTLMTGTLLNADHGPFPSSGSLQTSNSE